MKKLYIDADGNTTTDETDELYGHEAESEICFACKTECCVWTYMRFGKQAVEGFLDDAGGDGCYWEFDSWKDARDYAKAIWDSKNPSSWQMKVAGAIDDYADEYDPQEEIKEDE